MAGSIWGVNGDYMAGSIWAPTTFIGDDMEALIAVEAQARIAADAALANSISAAISDFNAGLALKANLAGGNVFTGKQAQSPISLGSLSGSITLDWSLGNVFNLTLAGGGAINFSNPTDGQIVVLHITMSAANSTLSFNSNILFSDGIAPILSTSIGAKDQLAFIYRADIDKYIGGAGVLGAL